MRMVLMVREKIRKPAGALDMSVDNLKASKAPSAPQKIGISRREEVLRHTTKPTGARVDTGVKASVRRVAAALSLGLLVGSPVLAQDIARFSVGATTLTFNANAFRAATPYSDDTSSALHFELGRAAAAAFAQVTAEHIGQTLAFQICGETLIEAQIRAQLGAQSTIPLEDPDAAERYAAILNGRVDCKGRDIP